MGSKKVLRFNHHLRNDMSLLPVLFHHKKFKALFFSSTEIVEILFSVMAIIVGIEIYRNFASHNFFYYIKDTKFDSNYIGLIFLMFGVAQWYVWYTDMWNGKRILSLFGCLLWLFFTALLSSGKYEQNFHSLPFIIASIANLWIYLRLGLLQDGLK